MCANYQNRQTEYQQAKKVQVFISVSSYHIGFVSDYTIKESVAALFFRLKFIERCH
jgi:hypothetical protein